MSQSKISKHTCKQNKQEIADIEKTFVNSHQNPYEYIICCKVDIGKFVYIAEVYLSAEK